MKRDYIKQVFTDLKKLKVRGVWLSGVREEGEYKKWNDDGQLHIHCFYKDGKLNGEYKHWFNDGQLKTHRLYKDDKVVKDYLK